MHHITGRYFFSRWPEFTLGYILWYVLKLWGRWTNLKWMKCFIFLLFYDALDLNNRRILRLPSIFQFDRTGTNLNYPIFYYAQFFIQQQQQNDNVIPMPTLYNDSNEFAPNFDLIWSKLTWFDPKLSNLIQNYPIWSNFFI